MELDKENFGGRIRGQIRGFKTNEKVQKASRQIADAEKKFSFPKTISGFVLSGLGGVMLWNHIPFASEVLWTGIGLFIAGVGFKLNRKLLGKETTNRFEKILIDLIKTFLKK